MNGKEEEANELVGDYDGAFVFWPKDVWNANDRDCAKLYNPQCEEVAFMSISPDMLDKTSAKQGCLVM